MFSDLIIYNYGEDRLAQDLAVRYVQELLNEIQRLNIDTSKLSVIDGNNCYTETYNAIGKIIDDFGPNLDTSKIYLYLYFLNDCGRNKQDKMCYGLNDKELQYLKKEFGGNDYKGTLFNSIIIAGANIQLNSSYGEAMWNIIEGGLCINVNVAKKSIWHEVAHLLGADDHYDKDTKKPKKICTDHLNCLMQWNSTQGKHFCSKSIAEIKGTVNKKRLH